MATTIYLVRHVHSLPDDIVTSVGYRQAQDLAGTLADIGVDVIVSSPSLRAIATVKPFSESAGIPIEIMNALREREVSRGLIENYLSVLEESWNNFDFKLPGCESARECQRRVVRCVRRIAGRHQAKNIVASSHGNAIALLLNFLDRSFGFEAWKELRNPDMKKLICSSNQIRWDKSFRADLHCADAMHDG